MKTLVVARSPEARAPIEAALRARGHEALAGDTLDARDGNECSLIVLAIETAEDVVTIREARVVFGSARTILAVAPNLDPLPLIEAGASDFVCDLDELAARLAVIERLPAEPDTSDLARQKDAQHRMLASERLASMGSLASCIAHEINNPLTYVIGNLSYAARGLSDLALGDDASRSLRLEMALADAREGVERIRRIVADLNIISQPEHDEEKIIDVRRVLETSINVAWTQIRHRSRLEKIFGETPRVRANEVRLGQVFLNLLLELSRGLPEGPAIDHVLEVHTGSDDRGDAMIIIRDIRGGASELGASETAPGLGIRISDTIIAGLGGRLFIEGPSGEEARVFRVILPAAGGVGDGETRPAEVEPEQHPKPVGRASILVVDDEPVIASTIRRALEGHEIYIVTSGRDALELCRGHAFDLVLCDLMMPDLTGMDLYEELRRDQNGREKRIVFMTGGAFTERARKFLTTVPWVEKPFDVDEIQSIVEKYFARGTELTAPVSAISATGPVRG